MKSYLGVVGQMSKPKLTQDRFFIDVKLQINKYVKQIDEPIVSNMLQQVQQGKMLRCKLIYMIIGEKEFLHSPNKQLYFDACKLGAIIEFIHLASLLHDDVLDNANKRRGGPTINFKYGNKKAIMLGDILYSFAFSKLSYMDNRIASSVANAVATLSVGELLDMEMSEAFNSNYTKYLDMIYKKTASLIQATCYCSGILAGKDATKLGEYGKNLGIAFQLIDDILDITSNEATLGKPSYNDFKEGKVSVPYILLYQRITHKQELERLHKKELNEKQKLWIQTSMNEFDVLEDSINIASSFGVLAMNAIDEMSNQDECSKELIKLANDLIKRDF